MTDCMPAVVREGLHAECSSGESKSAKRSRRAADAAREFVHDVAEHQTDSEEDDEGARRSKAKVARKAAAAPTGCGGGARAKLPRPEGTAICPRCNSDNTKFCYYNNYNIKQPRFLCKGCQRYWTEGGMLRNVPVGSGRRKSKNTQAREAEKAATADAAKQQSMIATGAFDTFQQMLMNPSLAYSAGGLGGAAAAAAAKAPMTGFGGAVVTGMAPLPPIAVQPNGFGGFSGAPGLPGFAGYPPAKPTDSGRMTAASDPAITALLGGPTTVTTSTVTTFSGGPAVELKGRDNGADARVKPTDSGAASGAGEVIAAQVTDGASPTIAGVGGGGLMYGAGGVAGPHSGFQSDWVAAAGQMQMAQQQLQQAAALQAQTHLRAAAVSLGQQQNPYLSGMWPYNTYSAGPSWAAAAYARLGQQQSWQSGAGSGQQMSGLSGASSGMDAGAALLPPPGMAAPVAAAPMWTQPWSAHMPAGAGAPTWGPVGGVPTASAPMGWPSVGGPPPMDNMGILSGSGGSMMSGGSNNSTATLLGKKSASLS